MKRLAKLCISLLVRLWDCVCSGARRITGRRDPAQGVVLYYHAVKPHQRAAFARQMDTLLRLARPWRVEHGLDGQAGRSVAVTFDDGFASMVENALPELKARNIPFTVFMPTGSWGTRPSWIKRADHPARDERLLSRDELRELATEPMVTIGSHSVTHPNFLTLDSEAAARELADSKQELETVLGRPVDLFSFPHGAHNGRLVEQACAAGYRRLFSVEPFLVTATDPSPVLGRVAAGPDDWSIEFRLKVLGAYRWMAKRGTESGKQKAEGRKQRAGVAVREGGRPEVATRPSNMGQT